MKRIAILVGAVAFGLTMIGYIYGLPPKIAGKALVKSLPKGVDGVELVANQVRAKPGFKFVKQTNGTVTVARLAGGGYSAGGDWQCNCWGTKGRCNATVSGTNLSCSKDISDPCNKDCLLTITIKGARTRVIAY